MKYLLDTHALLWWFTDDPRLSATAREAIADENNEIFVSAASAWEIATTQRLGKLPDVPDALTRFGELVAADGFQHLLGELIDLTAPQVNALAHLTAWSVCTEANTLASQLGLPLPTGGCAGAP